MEAAIIGIVIGLVIGLVAGYIFSQVVSKSKAAAYEGRAEELRKNSETLTSEKNELAVKLAALQEKTASIPRLEEENAKSKERNIELEKEVSVLETSLAESREKFQMLNEAEDKLKAAFENLSNKIFEENSSKFTIKNKENIGSILKPLQNQLSEFKDKVEKVYVDESKDRTALSEQIKNLKDLNEQISKDAVNLTHALKGDVKTQGAWGEVILEKVLEESGLRKGHEYETQLTLKDDEGKNKRPDVIVRLPDNKDVVIDSKVSLVAYERYHSSDDESEKAIALKEHISSVRNHIKELSQKSYNELPEIHSLDYVLMFIPIESAFITAIENDRNLGSEAFDNNIAIVSPSTLLATLKTIQYIWRSEQQTKNANEIAKKASGLYEKFCLFVDSLKDVGKNIDKANMSYEKALGQLSTGKNNLIRQVENIKSLGVKANKELPQELIDKSSNEELLIEDVEEEN